MNSALIAPTLLNAATVCSPIGTINEESASPVANTSTTNKPETPPEASSSG